MRWPSVHTTGALWVWAQFPFAILLFILFAYAVNSIPSEAWRAGIVCIGVFLVMSVITLSFPACPRCRLNAFLTIHEKRRFLGAGQYFGSRLQRRMYRPNKTCSRCGLDLTRYGIFDPRAKRENHV